MDRRIAETFSVVMEDQDFRLTFKMVNEVKLSCFSDYITGKRFIIALECLTALDVKLRNEPMSELVYTVPVFSSQPPPEMTNCLCLGKGGEALTSYYQALHPQQSGLMLTF